MNDIKQKIKDIVNASEDGDIREICGVIVKNQKGEYEVRVVKNIAEPMSQSDYVMCPEDLGEQTKDSDLFREIADNKFIAFWHTHPHTKSLPSQVDIQNAFLNRLYYIYSVRDDTINTFIIGGVQK